MMWMTSPRPLRTPTSASHAQSQAVQEQGHGAREGQESPMDSSSSSVDPNDAMAASGAQLAPMPSTFMVDSATAALSAAICALPWLLTDMAAAVIPHRYRRTLYRGDTAPQSAHRDYDPMIHDQERTKGALSRQEHAASPIFVHRLSFAYCDDERLVEDGKALALVCLC